MNTERSIRFSKFLACLYGVLGVWMTVVSLIITIEQDDKTLTEGSIGLIEGALILICCACFVYTALKGSVMGSNLVMKRIRTTIICAVALSCVIIPALALLLLGVSVSMTESTNMQKRLSINLYTVTLLVEILSFFSGLLTVRLATYLKGETSRTLSLNRRQLHQPFEQRQQHTGRCSSGMDPQLPAAFKISDVIGIINNSITSQPSTPLSYDNLSLNSSVISMFDVVVNLNNSMILESTSPPSLDASTTFLTSRAQPLSNQLHQSLEQRQQHTGQCSRGDDLPAPTAFTISEVDGDVNNSMIIDHTPPPSYDNLSVHLSVISNNITPPPYKAERTPPPSYSSVKQTWLINDERVLQSGQNSVCQ